MSMQHEVGVGRWSTSGKAALGIVRAVILGSSILSGGFASLGVAAESSQETKEPLWLVFEGKEGPGKGTHVVLVSGDEEYRSEEALPQLAKILATHHGFRCTVLFGIDPETGLIDPNNQANIPGLEALDDADLMIIATRFRNLQDDQMKHVVDYVNSGRPVIGLRTATHAFNVPNDRKYAEYGFRAKGWMGNPELDGGFGRQVLGETWINHHGKHGTESTRGVPAPGKASHPILRGVDDVWGPTDVYTVRLPLPGDSEPLLLGQVLEGMNPKDKPLVGPKNDPMMPVAWTKTYSGKSDKKGRVLCTTMGAAQDLNSEGLRRLLVNACYWAVGKEDRIPAKSRVDIVGTYDPSGFGFNGYRKGLRPSDYSK